MSADWAGSAGDNVECERRLQTGGHHGDSTRRDEAPMPQQADTVVESIGDDDLGIGRYTHD